MTGWTELDLPGKLSVVWAAAGIAATVLIGYGAVQMIQRHKKLEKRLRLDEDDHD